MEKPGLALEPNEIQFCSEDCNSKTRFCPPCPKPPCPVHPTTDPPCCFNISWAIRRGHGCCFSGFVDGKRFDPNIIDTTYVAMCAYWNKVDMMEYLMATSKCTSRVFGCVVFLMNLMILFVFFLFFIRFRSNGGWSIDEICGDDGAFRFGETYEGARFSGGT